MSVNVTCKAKRTLFVVMRPPAYTQDFAKQTSVEAINNIVES